MAICPKCRKEIETLTNFTSGETRYTFQIWNKKPHYQKDDFLEDGKTNDFECPECQEKLFTDEQQAEEFLKNEDKLQKIVNEKLNKIENGKH